MPISNSDIIAVLENAGIVALPTDTVYGLAIDPKNKMALQKLYHLKQRDANKPLVFMIADKQKLADLVYEINPETEKIIEENWPGPLTIIFKEKYTSATIGIRIPNNQFMLNLLRDWGKPLAVTSANLSGEKELLSRQEVEMKFGNKIDLYIDTDEKLSGRASTIIDVSGGGQIKVLRQGELKL